MKHLNYLKINYLSSVLILLFAVTFVFSTRSLTAEAATIYSAPSIIAKGHVQDVGDIDGTESSVVSIGTPGQGLRLEAVSLILGGNSYRYNDCIEYSVKVKGDIDWQSYRKGGDWAGTKGESKALLGFQARLTGKIATKYTLYYRIYVSELGWLSWTSNTKAGCAEAVGFQIEALELKIVPQNMNVDYEESAYPSYVAVSPFEKCIWGMDILSITQLGYESFSHANYNAIDAVGSEYFCAPFTGKVVYSSDHYGKTLYQSIEKVHLPNGNLDYITILMLHGDNIDELQESVRTGRVYSQGEALYHLAGVGAYGRANAFPVHLEIRVARGLHEKDFSGDIFPYAAFFVDPYTTNIINEGEMEQGNIMYNNAPSSYKGLWRYSSAPIGVTEMSYTDAVVITDNCVLRSGPASSYPVITRPAKNTKVQVLGTVINGHNRKWFYVKHNGVCYYVFEDHLKIEKNDLPVTVSGLTLPTEIISKGHVFILKGNITTSSEPVNITAVCESIDGRKWFEASTIIPSNSSFQLQSSTIDNAATFNRLPAGEFTIFLTANGTTFAASSFEVR